MQYQSYETEFEGDWRSFNLSEWRAQNAIESIDDQTQKGAIELLEGIVQMLSKMCL